MGLNVRKWKRQVSNHSESDMLKEVHSFKYLGARFNAEAKSVQEVKTRQVGQPCHTVDEQNVVQ